MRDDGFKADDAVVGYAWGQAFRLAGRRPVLMFGGVAAIAGVRLLGASQLPAANLSSALVVLCLALVEAAILTPIAIATHRFCILPTAAPARGPISARRYLRFFALAAVWTALFCLPDVLIRAMGGVVRPGDVGIVIWLVSFVPVVIVCLMTLLLFPAVAVDEPDPSLRRALLDGIAQWRRTLSVMILATIPLLLLGPLLAILVVAIGWDRATSDLGQLVRVLLSAAVSVLATAAYAAAASRLFTEYRQRQIAPTGKVMSGSA